MRLFESNAPSVVALTNNPRMHPPTGALLTAALREEGEGPEDALGDVRIIGATSLFVPGLPTPQPGATAASAPAGAGVAVEDAEGLARVFGFGAKGTTQQHEGAASTTAAASLELPLAGEEEAAAGGVVRPGEALSCLWTHT